MRIKILRGDRGKWYHNTDNIGREFGVKEYYEYSLLRFNIKGGYRVDEDDCVITELPESFCVKRCDDTAKWKKYIDWLNIIYDKHLTGDVSRYYGANIKGECDINEPFGTELHIDDIIKHIDFYSEPMVIESNEEFDMTTPEGRLAYAKRNYPVGTKYKSPVSGQELIVGDYDGHLNEQLESLWLIYYNGKWAEIIDEVKEEKKMETNLLELIRLFPELPTDYAKELVQKALEVKNGCLNDLSEFINSPQTTSTDNYAILPGNHSDIKADYVWRRIYDFKNKKMETQKLSRQGLKEIHSIACSNWKTVLERYGANSPLEDYIELTQEQVNNMFKACTKEQLPIVSKYLKQDDGSVDVKKLEFKSNHLISKRNAGEHQNKAFWLSTDYDWILNFDNEGELCLIPTKKKPTTSYGGPYAYGTASGVTQAVGSNTATVGRTVWVG